VPLALSVNSDTNYFDDANANEAMKAYWSAKQAGEIATLVKIDAIPGPPEDEDPEPEPTPPGGTVSDLAVARIHRHEKMLRDRGIALPPPVYAAGTKVVQLGEENFRTSRQAWEDMPETVEGLQGVYQAVQDEGREDQVIRVRDLEMAEDGSLEFGHGPVKVEANGLRALVSRNAEVFPRAGEYLATIDPDLRAWNFNRQVAQVRRDKKLKLRLRQGQNGMQVFAVTSPRYASFDADQIAVVLSTGLLDTEMRGEVLYDPRTTNLVVNGLYHADEVVDLAAGDVFKVGVQFRSNDAAGGSIRGRGIAWRNLCLNLIVIGTGVTELLRRKHIGAVHEVMADVRSAAEEASALFKDFAEEWNILRATPAAAVFEGDNVEERLVELAGMKELDVGVKRDVLVELLLDTWKREPGESLADLVNSVSAAHLVNDIDAWRRERFEEAAGMLVPVLAERAGEA